MLVSEKNYRVVEDLSEGIDMVINGHIEEAILLLGLHHTGSLFAHHLHRSRNVNVTMKALNGEFRRRKFSLLLTDSFNLIQNQINDDERARSSNTGAEKKSVYTFPLIFARN